MRASTLLFLFVSLLFGGHTTASVKSAPEFAATLSQLTGKQFEGKAAAIQAIAASQHEQSLAILQALMDGDLYYVKENNNLVLTETRDKKTFQITDAITGNPLGQLEKKQIKKVRINNRLRGEIRSAIAKLNLFSKDVHTRQNAIEQILKDPDDQSIAMLVELKSREQSRKLITLIDTAIAVNELKHTDYSQHLDAIQFLRGSMYPEVRVELLRYQQNLPQDLDKALSTKLTTATEKALKAIDQKNTIYSQIEKIFFGLSLGSVLLLVAVGLAITFGVMGVINMAHGEMLMLGAYTTYVVQQVLPNAINSSLFIALPLAFIVTALIGIAMERGIIRYLYGRPLETLLATFGISLVLQQAVRSIFSPLNRSVIAPDWMSGSLVINPALSLTYNRLFIILFSLAVLAGLMLLLSKTSVGLQMRAVTQNRQMAKAMGIRTDWVDALTFGLGSGIAGMAGVALSQLTNVGPNLGQSYIIDSFMVVVFGGVGNLWGTLFGAMTLGVANKFLEPFTGAVIAKILVLVFIILFIQKRPRGMFALKGRAVE